jgi:hypothetical protein
MHVPVLTYFGSCCCCCCCCCCHAPDHQAWWLPTAPLAAVAAKWCFNLHCLAPLQTASVILPLLLLPLLLLLLLLLQPST